MTNLDFAAAQHLPHAPAPSDRSAVLASLTKLFLGQPWHSRDEVAQFETSLCRLLPFTREDLRCDVAEDLADHAFTTPAMVQAFLAFDGPERAPFLMRCINVPRETLMDIARHGDIDSACLVAGRIDLDAAIVSALIDRGELRVLLKLARNLLSPLEPHLFQRMVLDARHNNDLALALCQRARDPLQIAPLFLQASRNQRNAILQAAVEAEVGSLTPCPSSAADEAMLQHLQRAARRSGTDEIGWAMSRLLGCAPISARTMVRDSGGEPLALLLAMLGATAYEAREILGARGVGAPRNKERTDALCELAMRYPAATARKLLIAMSCEDEAA
jgi:uncharacterized protein (DUF2336 family)